MVKFPLFTPEKRRGGRTWDISKGSSHRQRVYQIPSEENSIESKENETEFVKESENEAEHGRSIGTAKERGFSNGFDVIFATDFYMDQTAVAATASRTRSAAKM